MLLLCVACVGIIGSPIHALGRLVCTTRIVESADESEIAEILRPRASSSIVVVVGRDRRLCYPLDRVLGDEYAVPTECLRASSSLRDPKGSAPKKELEDGVALSDTRKTGWFDAEIPVSRDGVVLTSGSEVAVCSVSFRFSYRLCWVSRPHLDCSLRLPVVAHPIPLQTQ
jgi:hypothetical protein